MKNCRVCLREVNDDTPHWVTHTNDQPETYICEDCFKDEKIKKYVETGEFNSTLTMDAQSCKFYHEDARDGLNRLREEVRVYFKRYKDVLYKVAADYEEVQAAGRELELAWWLPVLQPYYNSTNKRGHCAKGKGFKALLWGCAGRVLLTLEDQYPKNDPKSKFGGASITLIFDEDGKEARGGIQSLAATKAEALALLKAAKEQQPKMKPDKDVTMAGLLFIHRLRLSNTKGEWIFKKEFTLPFHLILVW